MSMRSGTALNSPAGQSPNLAARAPTSYALPEI